MLADFFQLGVLTTNQYLGFYDLRLVVLSFLVPVAGSYIALDLTGRMRDISNTPFNTSIWLLGGAIAMGSGIWAMHFIGMLSFTIPGLTLRYDLFWTILSLIVAILASGFALYLLKFTKIRIEYYIIGGIILGLAIASMHYTGMEGLLITLDIRYLPSLFFVSILIAIAASEAAIWLALRSTEVVARLRNQVKLGSAFIMGVAICGMHYTGMAASIFTPSCSPSSPINNAQGLDPTLLAMGIAAITFVILGVAFFASSYKENINHQQFERARQLGMAEISASVLHNVGNVLNSVSVSAHTLSEEIEKSQLSDLNQLAQLHNDHKEDLVGFIAHDPRGKKSIDYISILAKYWSKQQQTWSAELASVVKNIRLIENIISTQQNLSKVTEFEEVISINELMNEAILITGLNIKKEITLIKHYGSVHTIKLDKVKLLQVLVNLLQNAKHAVLAAPNLDKTITITTQFINNKYRIEVTDNGIGISEKNIKLIFNYGFTTKESGHGFGLHTSAIAIISLGGTIQAFSQGINKGATFIIELKSKIKS